MPPRQRRGHDPEQGEGLINRAALPLIIATLALAGTARAAPVPRDWHAPGDWLRDAVCIHDHEGAWNAIGYVNGVATYGGGMQFMLGTFNGVGGAAASLSDIASRPPREQLYRAYLVWDRDAGTAHDGVGSWREWGTAGVCGLR